MKLALVHDWVVAIGGAERCLEVFHELWPEAPLFTLVCSEASVEKLGFSSYGKLSIRDQSQSDGGRGRANLRLS